MLTLNSEVTVTINSGWAGAVMKLEGDLPPLAVFATYSVAVSVKIIDIGAYDRDRPVYVCGTIALSGGTVDIAGDWNTGACVVRIAGFLAMSAADEGRQTQSDRA
ncbi:hypothetical protein [Mesorhizobium sp. M0771]|uniref:hypothetical protein n=1 Tax=unclassified Mesorhizobium TaxID=325217 RepID=UPI00333A61F8